MKMADVANEVDISKQNRNKRKRKKTFLQNARKYAKKGYYGRGSKLDEDTYQYFVRIMEAYKEGFPTDEEKRIFVNNVFEQTENEEINCSCNQVGCRVIETLLPHASNEILKRYFTAFANDLRPLCSDRFASHVIEALLKESCQRSGIDNEFTEECKEFTIKISRFLLNNMEDYIWDTYGNHTIRSVFYNLANIPREENKKNQKIIEAVIVDEKPISAEYLEVIKDYAERLITWPQFKDLPASEITSGFLQILLKTLQKVDPKMLKKYLQKLLLESFVAPENERTANALAPVFMSKASMMLLETALQIASSKMYTKIYADCFHNNIAKLAKMRSTNFAVQKLFNSCQVKEEFEPMFDEVADHFKEIIEAGHTGVILALGQACKRLVAKQGSFVQNLMKAFNCFEPEESQNKFVICLSKLVQFDTLSKDACATLDKDKLQLHGTLLLQLILEFNKPIKIVNSILSMEPHELKGLFSNSMGSHIVDSYVKSQFVGEKSREKLVRKMQGMYQDLASTKYGSRSFEAIWAVANMKFKGIIMEELVYKDAAWSNSECGKIISNKINFQLYKRNREDWKNNFVNNKTSKPKNIMDDVLNT